MTEPRTRAGDDPVVIPAFIQVILPVDSSKQRSSNDSTSYHSIFQRGKEGREIEQFPRDRSRRCLSLLLSKWKISTRYQWRENRCWRVVSGNHYLWYFRVKNYRILTYVREIFREIEKIGEGLCWIKEEEKRVGSFCCIYI